MAKMKALVCRECGKEYPTKAIHVCEMCLGPLEVKYNYAEVKQNISRKKIEDGPQSMWRYRELLPQLSPEDRDRLGLRLAQGWLRNGRLGRADTLLAADSSVEAFALRGKLALYRGDLGSARELLREAGPFAGDRTSATQRIGVLGLLQVIDGDSLPALGAALLRLERGDSAGAVPALEKVAIGLPPNRGGAELLLLAGQVQASLKKTADAEKLLRAAIGPWLRRMDHQRYNLLHLIQANAELLSPDEAFEDFPAILFDSAEQFAGLAELFLSNEPGRRAVTYRMRRVVVENFSYQPTMQRFLQEMAAYLKSAAAGQSAPR